MNCLRSRLVAMWLFCIILSTSQNLGAANNAPIIDYSVAHHPVFGKDGMVVSQRAIASRIGADILKVGGNAVDAAVATGYALAVVLPRAGNIGGGGFMLIYLAEPNKVIALDYREVAPAKAHKDLFLDSDGNVDNQLARFSLKSAGVPGTVAGFEHALKHYGTMSLQEVLQPAIELASQGFEVSWDLHETLKSRKEHLSRDSSAKAVFYPDGSAPAVGSILKQSDLAWTLKQISSEGKDGFYKGIVADRIVATMEAGGGLISHKDLKNYKVVEREAIRGSYRGFEIISMPPPSSGGVHIVQMLNLLENFPLADYGHGSARSIHLLTETMRYAYADRSKYLGDPAYFDVPVAELTDKGYASQLADRIGDLATSSTDILPGKYLVPESPDTTHFSVMDKDGNAVANTYTLNLSFGSGFMVEGAGFLLNNEMDDFSAKPGVANAFGLLGGEANKIEPGKRPLSSMTPTMVLKDGRPWVVTGSPGGSQIITSVLQQIVNIIDFDMTLVEATHAPRIHHQWLPDKLYLERGFSPDTIEILKDLGHNVELSKTMGSLQSIEYREGLFLGAADPRRPEAGAIAP